jgi:hypothetical protein
MKGIKKILAVFLAFMLSVNCLAGAAIKAGKELDLSETRDYSQEPLTEDEKKQFEDYLDDTLRLVKENVSRDKDILLKMEMCMDEKALNKTAVVTAAACASLILPVLSIAGPLVFVPAIGAVVAIMMASDPYAIYDFPSEYEEFLFRSERRKKKFDKIYREIKDESSVQKKLKKRSDLTKSFANILFNDPLAAFYSIARYDTYPMPSSELAEQRWEEGEEGEEEEVSYYNYFYDLLFSKKYSSSLIRQLKNVHKVLDTDPGLYSEYALRTLSSSSGLKYYENVARYIDMKQEVLENGCYDGDIKEFKEHMNKTYGKCPAKKVLIKEQRKKDKGEYYNFDARKISLDIN